MTAIKFCGLKTTEAVQAAGDLRAQYIGLMMWPKSSRALSVEHAASLARQVPGYVRSAGVFVNPSDDELKNILTRVDIDIIQLHGDEDPKRVADIRTLFGLPVIKAIRIATKDDLAPVASFESVADMLLFDAKIDSSLPGGTGQSFDWQILANCKLRKPWMLSGGLNAGNVGRALSLLKPDAVDVSSGIEDSPGIKNIEKMKKFITAVRAVSL